MLILILQHCLLSGTSVFFSVSVSGMHIKDTGGYTTKKYVDSLISTHITRERKLLNIICQFCWLSLLGVGLRLTD